MSESQPPESGLTAPEQHESSSQGQDPKSWAPSDQAQVPQQWSPPDAQPQVPAQYDPRGFKPAPPAGATADTGFTSAERFWYLLGNIALGAMYLRKVPAKKAMSEFGLAALSHAEGTWYTILCIACGLGYFTKIPTAKAVSELPQFQPADRA